MSWSHHNKNLSPSERFWLGECIQLQKYIGYPVIPFDCTTRLAILLLNLYLRSISFENYHSLTSNKLVLAKIWRQCKKKMWKLWNYSIREQIITCTTPINGWLQLYYLPIYSPFTNFVDQPSLVCRSQWTFWLKRFFAVLKFFKNNCLSNIGVFFI